MDIVRATADYEGWLGRFMPLVRADLTAKHSVRVDGRWLVRRLAPHCTRIELADLPRGSDEERLLDAMGFETANVHLGTRGARAAIAKQLRARDRRWLSDLAGTLAREIEKEWLRWSKQPR